MVFINNDMILIPLFPSWTRISYPNDLKTRYKDKFPAVFRVHLRAPRIPRSIGNDTQCILFIGYAIQLKRKLYDFLSSARNGTMGLSGGQTLYYYSHRSPGMAATNTPSGSWTGNGMG
jgi:hypothetical protein